MKKINFLLLLTLPSILAAIGFGFKLWVVSFLVFFFITWLMFKASHEKFHFFLHGLSLSAIVWVIVFSTLLKANSMIYDGLFFDFSFSVLFSSYLFTFTGLISYVFERRFDMLKKEI